jgi:hypothetical protein
LRQERIERVSVAAEQPPTSRAAPLGKISSEFSWDEDDLTDRIEHNHRFVLRVQITTVSRGNWNEIGLVFIQTTPQRQGIFGDGN